MKGANRWAWALMALGMGTLLAAGCGSDDGDGGNTGTTPDIAVAQDVPPPEDVHHGGCSSCLESIAGKTMRFTALEVTEPSDPPGLPDFLNNIWQEDVRRSVLNIMLRIDTFDTTTGEMTLTGGSAWHNLNPEDLPQVPGGDLTNVPTTYHFLTESTTEFTATLDNECHFETSRAAMLPFHPGPQDHAYICAPDNGNAIPLSNLVARGYVSDDCNGIVQGTLSGCIGGAAACKICSFLLAPDYRTWLLEERPDITEGVCDLAYCGHYCGDDPDTFLGEWASFGAFVKGLKVPINCDSDGDGTDDGYLIEGNFTATVVPAE